MRKKRPHYAPEFRRQAVELVWAGRSPAELENKIRDAPRIQSACALPPECVSSGSNLRALKFVRSEPLQRTTRQQYAMGRNRYR